MNIRTKFSMAAVSLATAASMVLGVSAAHAQTASTTAAKAARVAAAVAKGISRADQEISRRIDALNMLATRIASAKRVTDTDKALVASTVQAQIASLTSLKAKIDADTDAATLKTDVKSIADSYRIFMLVIPQGHLLASVDSVNAAGDALTALAAKLQTRVSTAQSAGKDVTALTASLSDLAAKVADAKSQVSAAEAEVSVLKPDQGDKTVMASNEAALKDARSKIQAANADLKAARADAQSVVRALREMNGKLTATSTAQQ